MKRVMLDLRDPDATRGTPDGGADVACAHRALASFLQLCLTLRLSRLSCETSAPTKEVEAYEAEPPTESEQTAAD